MTRKSRQELLDSFRPEYQTASALEKIEIIDAVVAATGFNRKYSISLLNKETNEHPETRKRKRVYDDEFQDVLIQVWEASNRLCSKRLAPFIPELAKVLASQGHIKLKPSIRRKLNRVSAATIDRILRTTRSKHGSGRSFTRPGNLLKSQIQVRTFTEWNDAVPGFFEADLVAHSGSDPSGQFLQTLTITDIRTQWTECAGLLRRGELEVRSALQMLEKNLPFPFLGLDTDNGYEFINYNLFNWCNEREITFTRGRPYKKNDQAYVEERNGSIVRKLVGYERLEGRKALRLLNQFYAISRLYNNFFQPSLKLLHKTRQGAKVYRKYDKAKTPFQRILASKEVSKKNKESLKSQYKLLDPIDLLNQMNELQEKLQKLAVPSIFPKSKRQKQRRVKPSVQDVFPVQLEKNHSNAPLKEMILSQPPGTIIQAIDLLQFASRSAIDVALSRLSNQGLITKIGWGVYKTKSDEDNLLSIESKKINEATDSYKSGF